MNQPLLLKRRAGPGRPARSGDPRQVRIEANVPAELWEEFAVYAARERRTMAKQLQVVLEAVLAADRRTRENPI